MRMSGVGVLYRDPGLGLPVHVCHGTRCCFKIINVSLVMDRNSKFLGILGYVIKWLPASRIGPPSDGPSSQEVPHISGCQFLGSERG
jgi:hypothetical protein